MHRRLRQGTVFAALGARKVRSGTLAHNALTCVCSTACCAQSPTSNPRSMLLGRIDSVAPSSWRHRRCGPVGRDATARDCRRLRCRHSLRCRLSCWMPPFAMPPLARATTRDAADRSGATPRCTHTLAVVLYILPLVARSTLSLACTATRATAA